VVHGNGEFTREFNKWVILGFAKGGSFVLVVDGFMSEGIEFADAGIHRGFLLGSEGRGFGFAALDAEFFALLAPNFVEVIEIGAVAEHAGLDAVEEKIHAGDFGIGFGFESALGFVIGVIDSGEFEEAVGEGSAEGVCKIDHGRVVGFSLGGLVVRRHDPSGFGIDRNFESGGLDNDASVGVAEPFEVKAIRPVVGNGAFFSVEGGQFLERAVEDLDFAGCRDVADVSGLLRNDFGSGFAGGSGSRVFENDAMAREIAPRVADEVEGEGFLVAGEMENASGAAWAAVVDFALENLSGKAECHEVD
jgi:hypothetical protein